MEKIKKFVSFMLVLVMAGGIVFSTERTSAQAASKPAKPVIEVTSANNGKSITVTIEKNSKTKGYRIYMKGPSDSKFKKVKTLKKDGTAVRTVTFKNLEAGKYSIKVKAYTKSGKKTVYSAYSKTKSIKLKPSNGKTTDNDSKKTDDNGQSADTGTTNPGGDTSNPGTGTGNQGGGTSSPGTGTSNPGGGTSNPGGGTSNPGGGTSNPGGGTSNPGSGTSNPGTGTNNNVSVTLAAEYFTGETQSTIDSAVAQKGFISGTLTATAVLLMS